MAGCERSSTLRVVSINGGNTLRSDLADFFCYFDKSDSSDYRYVQTPADSVKVELEYLEVGAGLPTWTPYEALLNQATVTFVSKVPADPSNKPQYQKVAIPLTIAVPADPTGKSRTSFWVTVCPASWKQLVLGEYAATDDPFQLDLVDLAQATITFTGHDSVANRDVSASGTFPVEFGNFWDDTTKFGK